MYSALCYGPASLVRWFRGDSIAAENQQDQRSKIEEGLSKQKQKLDDLRAQQGKLQDKREAARHLYRRFKEEKYVQIARDITVEMEHNREEAKRCQQIYLNLTMLHSKQQQNAETLETATLLQSTTAEIQHTQSLMGRPEDLVRVQERAEAAMATSDSFSDAISRPLGVSPDAQRDNDDIRDLELLQFLQEEEHLPSADSSSSRSSSRNTPTKADKDALRVLYPERYRASVPPTAASSTNDPFTNWSSVKTPFHEMQQQSRKKLNFQSPSAKAEAEFNKRKLEQQQHRHASQVGSSSSSSSAQAAYHP